MTTITLPYKFRPRDYQLPFLSAIDNGVKRAIIIWPRRHGKDKTCFNALAREAFKRVGNYYYVFPEYNQGRKALWDNIDSSGFRTINHIPDALIKSKNNTEMKIELINGSIIQVVGASDIDRIVGSNPAGVVFSEYSLIDPNVWGYIYPILAENGGFAWFNMTPRGDNHAKHMYETYKDNPDWFVERLTALEAHVFTAEELEDIKAEYFKLYGSYDLYEQEFMTSFEAPVQGAYYADQLRAAEAEKRITNVPYDRAVMVYTSWDLGMNDTTAIWFWQTVGQEIHVIDYYEMSGEPLSHYAKVLKEKPYAYALHYLPHDAKARELGTGKSRVEVLEELRIGAVEVLPATHVQDGIEQARMLFGKCWFDATKCERGLTCLRNYRKDFDDKNKVWRSRPLHDWSSNGADSFRYAAVGYQRISEEITIITPEWIEQAQTSNWT